jgi:2-keto-4-pentenoate hydratase/2-oxohepta-3-ene-1,7-dioic acid hydratase in catechol pathway
MKIAVYSEDGSRRIGVVDDDGIWSLNELDPSGILAFASAAPEERDQAYERARRQGTPRAPSSVRLLPPVTPPTIRDFVTFEAHVEGMVRSGGDATAVVMPDWYDAPTFYFSNTNALVASGEDVAVPPGCQLLDFELEVAAIIGSSGRDLSAEEAEEHIVGYTIFNDWSARDLGAREIRMGLGMAKAKDFASTLGPWLVTTDELKQFRHGDRYDLELVSRVNDTEIGRDSLAHMAWSFGSMVAYASRGAWVRPGDVFASGTCGGGCLAEQWGRRGSQEPPPLRPGDAVTLEVQGIGSVTNRVVAGVDLRPIPRATSARRLSAHQGRPAGRA